MIELALRRSYGLTEEEIRSEDFAARFVPVPSEQVAMTAEHAFPEPVRSLSGIKELGRTREEASILPRLDDTLEWQAHAAMLERLGLHAEAVAALRHL